MAVITCAAGLKTALARLEWSSIRESLAPLVCSIMRLADGAASGDWRFREQISSVASRAQLEGAIDFAAKATRLLFASLTAWRGV
jgi:hypothetical protein